VLGNQFSFGFREQRAVPDMGLEIETARPRVMRGIDEMAQI
jgi:hypothetical protein